MARPGVAADSTSPHVERSACQPADGKSDSNLLLVWDRPYRIPCRVSGRKPAGRELDALAHRVPTAMKAGAARTSTRAASAEHRSRRELPADASRGQVIMTRVSTRRDPNPGWASVQ